MSKKSLLSSRSRTPLSGDISSISIFQEEIPDLAFSRRVEIRNINHLQTLSGHILDILTSLSELLEKTYSRLNNSCQHFSVDPSAVCESLFLSVCRYYLLKAEKYEIAKLKLTDENSALQTEDSDLLRFAFGRYLELTKNSTRNNRNKKAGSLRKSEQYKNKNGNIFDIRSIRIKKMSRIMWIYYNDLHFEKWCTINKSDIQECSYNDDVINNPQFDFSTIMDEIPDDKESRFIYSILSYYTETSKSVADRSLLNEIYNGFWENECIIHGSSHNNSFSHNRVFKLPGDQSLKNRKNKKNISETSIDLCLDKSYDEKINYANQWLNNLPEKSRLLIIARTEEELISLAINLQNQFSTEAIYFSNCGLVVFSSDKSGTPDTKLFKIDKCSETIEKMPVNTSSVSMYTYKDFLQRFLSSEENETAAKGELLLSSILLWSPPDEIDGKNKGYSNLLKFLRENKIPAMVIPGTVEKNAAKFYSVEEINGKEKEFPDADLSIGPVLTKIKHEILDKNHKLNSDFTAAILKNQKNGLNQIILCPNSLYVQKLYNELWKLYVDKGLPVKHLEIYHSLFGLMDKQAKRQKIVDKVNQGGAIVVSTLNFFPDLICEFPILFIEGLPFERWLQKLKESMHGGDSEKKTKPSPQIFWSEMKEKGKDPDTLLDDSIEGNQILIPFCNITENQDVDFANRIIVPDHLTENLTGYKASFSFGKIGIRGKKQNISKSKLPYNSNLGLIGPPQWMDKFMA